jgi:hypothetical protein
MLQSDRLDVAGPGGPGRVAATAGHGRHGGIIAPLARARRIPPADEETTK